MKEETTRRKFLCDVVAVSLLGTYGCWNKNPLDSKKKAAIY